MSSARRLSLMSILMTCVVLAITAPTARAQMGFEPTPHGPAITSQPQTLPTARTSLSLESMGLGMPLQMGASLAAYRWFDFAMGRIGLRPMNAMSRAPQGSERSTWWRKRS